jgi:type II secretion system protein H
VSRRGFTLIEILLVLAIIVVMAAAAAPALRGVMQDAALKHAADTVRIHWTKAHVKAMKTGRIQVFRFEVNGNRFTVQPWAAADDALEAAPTVLGFGTAEEETASPRLDTSVAVVLPEGTQFVGGQALADQGRSQSIVEKIQDANRFEANWSQPILFYPDGSTSDAYVIVAGERQVGIRIELRGMTGTTTIGEITDVQELKDLAEQEK